MHVSRIGLRKGVEGGNVGFYGTQGKEFRKAMELWKQF